MNSIKTPQASQEEFHAASDYDAPVHFVSPLSMVASSLLGWNGPLKHGDPNSSNLAIPIASPERNFEGTKFFESDPPSLSTTDSCNATSQSYAGMIPWGCVSSSSSSQSTDSFDAPQSGEVGSSSYDDEFERAQALQEYGIGLNNRVMGEVFSPSPCYLSYEDLQDGGLSFEPDMEIFYPPF